MIERREPSREQAGRLAPGDRVLLEEVRGQEQRPGAPGVQHPDLARDGVGSRTDLRRIPQIAQVGGSGTRSEGTLGSLAQQLADPGSTVAHAALQMPPRGAALWSGSTQQARRTPVLSVASLLSTYASPALDAKELECGRLAALFCVWLEWGQRLCRSH